MLKPISGSPAAVAPSPELPPNALPREVFPNEIKGLILNHLVASDLDGNALRQFSAIAFGRDQINAAKFVSKEDLPRFITQNNFLYGLLREKAIQANQSNVPLEKLTSTALLLAKYALLQGNIKRQNFLLNELEKIINKIINFSNENEKLVALDTLCKATDIPDEIAKKINKQLNIFAESIEFFLRHKKYDEGLGLLEKIAEEYPNLFSKISNECAFLGTTNWLEHICKNPEAAERYMTFIEASFPHVNNKTRTLLLAVSDFAAEQLNMFPSLCDRYIAVIQSLCKEPLTLGWKHMLVTNTLREYLEIPDNVPKELVNYILDIIGPIARHPSLSEQGRKEMFIESLAGCEDDEPAGCVNQKLRDAYTAMSKDSSAN